MHGNTCHKRVRACCVLHVLVLVRATRISSLTVFTRVRHVRISKYTEPSLSWLRPEWWGALYVHMRRNATSLMYTHGILTSTGERPSALSRIVTMITRTRAPLWVLSIDDFKHSRSASRGNVTVVEELENSHDAEVL
jgi:hypothetical protein